MCGISGILSSNPTDLQAIQTINDVMEHRGPDGAGLMLSAGIPRDGHLPGLIDFSPQLGVHAALGHRRLAILDLSELGHQPMVYANRYVITFNGEIFNHVELRAELEALGHRFHSHSDTEVILAAYASWGAGCLRRFNGMWAFVIIDCERRSVFIARDRFGIKPLYYYQSDDLFVFGSEIKAVMAHPRVKTAPDRDFSQRYLERGAQVRGTQTAFENIRQFPPASYVECSLSELTARPLDPRVFWSVEPNLSEEPYSETKAVELAGRYFLLLEDAVRLRLRADVKVGSALSGGLDSSSIVFLINRILREQGREEMQETFSCVYRTPGTESCDESVFINRLARALGVRSNQIEPRAEDVPSEHERMICAMDFPPESTCMSGWHTFKRVAQSEVTVTLDGQGADEQLGGYLIYWMYFFARLPLWKALASWPRMWSMPGASRPALWGLCANAAGCVVGRARALRLLQKLGYRTNPFMPVNQILHHDLENGLRTLIHYSDRVSMAWSIESRMPFMDYRMVEFLASVPAAYKLHNGWTKYLARRAFDGKLPDEIVWRKDKVGWAIPEDFWFEGQHRDWLNRQIESPTFTAWFGSAERARAQQHAVTTTLKVRILNLAKWYDLFFSRTGRSLPTLGRKVASGTLPQVARPEQQ